MENGDFPASHVSLPQCISPKKDLLIQWLNFKLFGITYLLGKIKLKLVFQGPLAESAK